MNLNYLPVFGLAGTAAFSTFMYCVTLGSGDPFTPVFLGFAVFTGLISVPCGVQAALKADREEPEATQEEEELKPG